MTVANGRDLLPLATAPVPDRITGRDQVNGPLDCLLIGFNDLDFPAYVDDVRAMGTDSGAYQDLRLAFVEVDGKPYRALDLLSKLYEGPGAGVLLHNSDFLWPVITYLGSFLARRGFRFDYVNLFHLERESLRRKLEAGNVRTVAITTTLYVSAPPIQQIVAFVRECAPDVPIVIGGPYVANQAKMVGQEDLSAILEYLGGDIYVVGREGERTLAQLLAAIDEGASLSRVPNLAYRDGQGFAFTREDVESNPLEDNMADYSIFGAGAFNEFVTTRTAKSCPFSCAFCGFPQRAGKYTYLDVEHVRCELDHLAQIPSVSTITFIDDTFNVPRARFREVLRMMIDRGYDFKWNCFYRSDHGDPETIRLMREAGCEGVFLGIESGSDEMLGRMNKSARRADYLEALEVFNEVGISSYASLIIGFPGETEETVAETISLLEQGKPDFYRAQLWYADPVTPIWKQRDRYGVRGEAFSWKHDTMDSATACRIINEMFTSVRNSIWLPQFGFEQWSVFYLQRRGMTMAQVKEFVRAFNALVADQIADGDSGRLRPDLYARLKAACQFDLTLPAMAGQP
jgi:anaerobic magnesium-protoporphyrin IX monomethyl ester cyclase